ncbi:MAG: GNAT family N-acetyltransferase [Defluviitaleaceae bacterium]|nr:GNAT family N-acetyltransferase [Defluviitaleaceae bacterium]
MKNKQVTQFGVCKMEYKGGAAVSDLSPVLLRDEYYVQYQQIVDEAFYEMRKALNIRPFDAHRYTLMNLEDLKQNTYIVLDGDNIICGATIKVTENGVGEIDSLVVNPKYQRQGFGRKIAFFAVSHLQSCGVCPITLSVTSWNRAAVRLYQSMGFEIIAEAMAEGVNTQDADGNWRFEFVGETQQIMRR